MRPLPVLLALAMLLAACAQPGGTASGGNDQGTPDDLHVEYDPGDGSTPGSWTLTCGDSVGGTHPDAQAACERLAGLDDPFAPLPDDIACTEQYGGPQTAHVTGRWRGEEVDLELSRTDGCRISQWDGLVPLVPPGS